MKWSAIMCVFELKSELNFFWNCCFSLSEKEVLYTKKKPGKTNSVKMLWKKTQMHSSSAAKVLMYIVRSGWMGW